MANRPPVPKTADWLWTGTDLLYFDHATDTLVIQKTVGRATGTYTYPLEQIAGVQIFQPKMIGLGSFRVSVAGERNPGASAGMRDVLRDPYAVGIRRQELAAAERIKNAVITALEKHRSGSPAAASVGIDGQLANLQNLHAQGALTDEEFADAKRKVLGG